MKTMNRTIICAAAVIAMAGCTKEMEMPAEQELTQLSFTGIVDNNAGTKTALTSDYNVTWTAGDQISVLAGGNNGQFTAANIRADESTGLANSVATFEGMAAVADTYYAIYPYNEGATMNGTVITTVLPTDQTAVAGSFAVGANLSTAKTAASDILQFRNAGAIIGLTVNGEGITGVRLMSADGTKPMSGTVNVDVAGDTPVMTVTDGAVSYVRLVAAEGTALESGSTYYFVVAPGEYNGLQLVFENAGLDATCTKTTAEVVSVARNGNKNLGSFTIGEGDWVVNTYADYELDGKAAVDEFIASVPEGEKMELRNLTVKGHDVNDAVLNSLAAKISAVRGILTFDGIGSENNSDWLDMNNFVSKVDCRGSIIFRNISNIVNPNGFDSYTSIGGDFIIENCPNFVVKDWAIALSKITEITGDLILNGVNSLAGSTFNSLRKVGGKFELTNVTGVWSLKGGMQIEQIGGDLVIKDNESLWSLHGFESLVRVGGNVVISNNNPKMPVSSGVVDGDDCIGLCLIKDLKEKGVFGPDATFTIATGEDNHSVSIDELPSCNPDITSKSYVLIGYDEVQAFIDGADPNAKETVYDLFVSGADVTEGQVRDLDNRVGTVEGTLTLSELGTSDTWVSTDQVIENMTLKGSLVMKNIPAHINPNGLQLDRCYGDIVIENCPQFPADWDPFKTLKQVDGDIRIIGPMNGFSARFFRALEIVGGDFHIEGIGGFFEFTRAGDTGAGEDPKMPGIIKEIGGDFTIVDCPDFSRDAVGFWGFDSIEHIGGNVTLRNTNTTFPRESSGNTVGLCIIKHYMETGVISQDATVTVEDNTGVVDMSTITSCTGQAAE